MLEHSDRGYNRRMVIAVAGAVAVHEIVAGLFPNPAATVRPEAAAVVQLVEIIRRTPPPRATPSPPPPPTPQPHSKVAPQVAVRNPAPRAAAPPLVRGGSAAVRRIARVRRATKQAPASLANGTGAGVNAGGKGSGAGQGTGNGGDNGSGSGTSGTGTGTAGDTSTAPCGFVELTGHRAFNWNNGRHERDVSIVIHLRSGEVVKDDLHWAFHYESEDDDPFSDRHRNDDFPTLLQQPPAGYDLEGKQKPATIFAVRHTGPDGFTVLDECSVATR